MKMTAPSNLHIPALRALWTEAFGDDDEYLDIFFSNAFSPDRCRCAVVNGEVAAALYWLDCSYKGGKLAYLYAIATAKTHRGQGICRLLMADAHRILTERGYDGVILVPGSEGLFTFYERMGYITTCHVDEFTCQAALEGIGITKISPDEYTLLRRQYLPQHGVIQENENIALLAAQAELYKGEGFLLAAEADDAFRGTELLGDTLAASKILNALGYKQGTFRTVGSSKPFAMYLPLVGGAEPPKYFGFAFD